MGLLPSFGFACFVWISIFLPINLLKAQTDLITKFHHLEADSQVIDNGLTYYHYWSDDSINGSLSIHLLKVSLQAVRLEVCLAQDQIIGQETTSSMVQRKGAMAGINGGFSFSNDPWNPFHGDPKDFFMLNGKILSEPFSTRSSLGISNTGREQRVLFDRVGWAGKICDHKNNCLQLTGINRQRQEQDLILYTNEYNRTTLTDRKGKEMVVSGDSLLRFSKGSSAIPENGFVISASGKYQDSLTQLERGPLKIEHRLHSLLHPNEPVQIKTTSYQTAGPILISDRRIYIDQLSEQIPSDFIRRRHPRTGIGLGSGGREIFLVVVDGRQPSISLGMSLPEFAGFFLWLGATHAYNLDGGGSSTMVIRGKIVNSPSDPKERRRCDALLLFKKEN